MLTSNEQSSKNTCMTPSICNEVKMADVLVMRIRNAAECLGLGWSHKLG